MLEENEEKYGMFAAKQDDTKRICEKEGEHKVRSKFERDRDRILYSKAFRRLSGKTQVFVTSFDDHVRTRLTHTLEVSQITTTICRALNFNEILGEAIAIGHDIGHTPFGHVGERTLNYIMTGCDNIKGINNNMDNEYKGFKHNWQGLRTVMELEKISRKYNGLNLTPYTLWGILNHSKKSYGKCGREFVSNGTAFKKEKLCSLKQTFSECDGYDKKFSLDFYNKYEKNIPEEAWTVEALVVRQADEIAQRHHDIEDALEANIIEKEELICKIEEYFGSWLSEGYWSADLNKIKEEENKVYYMPMISKLIVDFLTTKYIENLKEILDNLIIKYDIKSSNDFHKYKSIIKRNYEFNNEPLFEVFSYDESLKLKEEEFQKYLRYRILNSFLAQAMDGKSSFILRQIIKAYVSNPQQLPDKTILTLYKNYLKSDEWGYYEGKKKSFKYIVGELRNKLNEDYFTKFNEEFNMILLRTICDYIAGMTDSYAIEQYNLLYGSKHIGQI